MKRTISQYQHFELSAQPFASYNLNYLAIAKSNHNRISLVWYNCRNASQWKWIQWLSPHFIRFYLTKQNQRNAKHSLSYCCSLTDEFPLLETFNVAGYSSIFRPKTSEIMRFRTESNENTTIKAWCEVFPFRIWKWNYVVSTSIFSTFRQKGTHCVQLTSDFNSVWALAHDTHFVPIEFRWNSLWIGER